MRKGTQTLLPTFHHVFVSRKVTVSPLDSTGLFIFYNLSHIFYPWDFYSVSQIQNSKNLGVLERVKCK